MMSLKMSIFKICCREVIDDPEADVNINFIHARKMLYVQRPKGSVFVNYIAIVSSRGAHVHPKSDR
jgi:hypothetical protein